LPNEVDPDFKSKKYKISVFPYRELSPEEIDKVLPYGNPDQVP
jgi:hypothetical protein